MANEEQLAILKQGVEVWNEWRIEKPGTLVDLSGTDLSGLNLDSAILVTADLTGVNLHKVRLVGSSFIKANLTKANLSGADLVAADLSGAILNKADLTGADLMWAKLNHANLHEACLSETELVGTDFSATNLKESNFRNARFLSTVFGDVDLSQAKGLDGVFHLGPSTIGIDTIYKSRGNIPEIFLRGAGVPENFITFMHSLTGRAFEYYSCFISHSVKDKHFCERLYADLQAKGVRVWYFPEDAKWGEHVWGEIDRSIKIYDKLIVVCSENSLQSIPVQREMERALNREDKEHTNILFPIRIDDFIFEHWEHERKADALAKVVGDFSGWERDAAKYEKAFDKLLKGLQAESLL